jgi:hypothetical protein
MIDPGFDLFATDPGSTFVNLVPFGGGIVPLEGVPLPGFGNADTIVQRLDGLPPATGGTVDIELVALSLRSVDPVDIGLGPLFDLEVISGSLLGEPANPLGTMTIVHTDPNGGKCSMIRGIDTTFLVQVEIAEHPVHEPARSRFTTLLDAGDTFALAPQVLAEFIHIVTDAKRFSYTITDMVAGGRNHPRQPE